MERGVEIKFNYNYTSYRGLYRGLAALPILGDPGADSGG